MVRFSLFLSCAPVTLVMVCVYVCVCMFILLATKETKTTQYIRALHSTAITAGAKGSVILSLVSTDPVSYRQRLPVVCQGITLVVLLHIGAELETAR